MFDGYLNRPDATVASFDGEWFRTGDAAVIDDGGFHRIVGRQSIDIIKTGGFKVGAGEVEAALLTHPTVAEAAVIGVPDDDLGQRIVAFVVGDGRRRAGADRSRRRPAVGAQASTRGPRRRRAPAQRHGQGPKDAPVMNIGVWCGTRVGAKDSTGWVWSLAGHPGGRQRLQPGQTRWVTRSPMPSMVLVSTSPGCRKRGGLRA